MRPSPLIFRYDLTAVDDHAPMRAADTALTNLELTDFHSLVETFLRFNDGTTRLIRMGWEADGTFLGDRKSIDFQSGHRDVGRDSPVWRRTPRRRGSRLLRHRRIPEPITSPGARERAAPRGLTAILMVRRLGA